MKRTLMVSAIVLAIALILTFIWMAMSIANNPNNQPEKPSKPIVLVTVAPYKEMVTQLAGDAVNVITVIPENVDPHNWEPTYKDMTRLRGAVVWFTVGEGFEPSLSKKLSEVNKDMKTFNLNKQITPPKSAEVHHSHDNKDHVHFHEFDTHTWLSPVFAKKQARFIARILSDIIPLHDTTIKENYLKLEEELKELDLDCAHALLPFHGDILVTTHGAYTSYCEDYNLIQKVIEPSGGKEPRLGELSSLVSELKKNKERIIGIFTQPQHTNKAAAIIARDLDMPLYEVDPYAEDYTETIRRLTMIISSSSAEGDPT